MTDISLYSVEKGAGEPLILLHGNGEDGSYFARQIERFSRDFRVFAVDTRGHGRSPRGSAPFTIRQFAEDLCGFMDEKAIGRADLLGFSDGGNIALVFALRYPERVNRLVLNGANLDARGVKARYQIPIELGYRIARLFAGRSEKARRNAEMLGLMVNDPAIDPEALCAVRNKTLVVAGTRDMIRERHTRLIAEKIPGAQLALLPGSHFIAAENPEAFNRTVAAFLQA